MIRHIYKIIACMIAVFGLPLLASAATISLTAEPRTVGVGDLVNITLTVDSDIPVNTFSGSLHYSRNMLDPESVSDGSSIVGVWLTRPTIDSTSVISFAGLTPGGYRGVGGKVYSVVFRAKKAGTATLTLDSLTVLRNDGSGTREPVAGASLQLSIQTKSLGGYTGAADADPPEPFAVYLTNSSNATSGDQQIVFSAVDKNSGIDHYEAAEKRPFFFWRAIAWEKTESPYTIHDQNLFSDVYIKAVDHAGNERISVFPHRHFFSPSEWLILLGILTVFIIAWYMRWKRKPLAYETLQ
ncbi:hypothetical protein A3H16_00325 [Candidatus Kaiserbacteria bacterium RIFCSPLOWO2_12_FULL_53_8]|uniref:Cohesin domain-containing protein n=1 Tax=Candidatus Kaiserbacteria bacterium RIFCSPLOWO2_12_FULL_53_8 TaxID=1798529 RepID=A0A1F6G0N8_9BACT|nr:MAG: hypothetical protein A3H16_00325 [Candidatus Kaiserbacteria bacterium RIFCSPLOWO2_12_FULL_53_8]